MPADENVELRALIGLLPASLRSDHGERALPQVAIVDTPSGRRLKVRAYPTESSAIRQEQILRRIGEKVGTPELLGRIDHYLVFDHLEVREVSGDREPEFYDSIGRTLSDLASFRYPATEAEQLDSEVRVWLIDLRRARFVSAWGEETLWLEYQRLRPERPRICLGYWDAMPHNFGQVEDKFVLLDEKHLQPSFEGVGLVKPSLILPPESFARILAGYRQASSSAFIDEHRRFLKLYYLLGALHYYLMRMADGANRIPGNARLRSYRWQAFRLSTPGLRPCFLESARFTLQFPLDSLRFMVLKLIHPLTWRKLLGLNSLERFAWDESAS